MENRIIRIFDTTLRDGEQSPGCSMDLQEKLEVARQLERMRVDVIEAGFAISSPGDFESVRSISETIRTPVIASLSRLVEKDIKVAADAVKGAALPRIHTFIATSDIHLKYKLKMSRNEVLERTASLVKYAKSFCEDVEFSAEDATRSDPEYLAEVLKAAILNGATVVNVPDTVGYATPAEMHRLIDFLRHTLPSMDRVELSVHCHNDLGMGVANSLSAVAAGATQVECTINGIGERAGNASLEEIVMSLKTRNDFYKADTKIDTRQIYAASRMVSSIIGVQLSPTKPIIGANAFAHEAGIHQHGVMSERTTYEIMSPESIGIPQNKMVLGKHSGRHAFESRLTDLGFNLTKVELDEAFERFKSVADRKKTVTDGDISAIVGQKLRPVENGYELERFIVNSGNTMPATAVVKLAREGEIIEDSCMGDGPIDASFKAIDRIVAQSGLLKERPYSMDDYQIRSVSEGEDALGEVIVKIKVDGEAVTGRGLSTDIIEASIRAYINGINKLITI